MVKNSKTKRTVEFDVEELDKLIEEGKRVLFS